VASHNPGKVAELKKLLEHLSVTVFSLDDFDNIPEVAEDEATYEKNAIKSKGLEYFVGHYLTSSTAWYLVTGDKPVGPLHGPPCWLQPQTRR